MDASRCLMSFWSAMLWLQVPAPDVMDWVYSLQVLPLSVDDPSSTAVNKGI